VDHRAHVLNMCVCVWRGGGGGAGVGVGGGGGGGGGGVRVQLGGCRRWWNGVRYESGAGQYSRVAARGMCPCCFV